MSIFLYVRQKTMNSRSCIKLSNDIAIPRKLSCRQQQRAMKPNKFASQHAHSLATSSINKLYDPARFHAQHSYTIRNLNAVHSGQSDRYNPKKTPKTSQKQLLSFFEFLFWLKGKGKRKRSGKSQGLSECSYILIAL